VSDPLREAVRRFYEDHHEGIGRARVARRYYYDTLTRLLKVRVPPGARVLDVGCGSGHTLAALTPSFGVGVDLSAKAVAEARQRHAGKPLHFFEGDGSDPRLLAELGGPFDVVLLVNVVTHLTDVQRAFEALQLACHARTRVLIYSYSRLWQPLLRLAEATGLKYQPPPEAWLPPEEVQTCSGWRTSRSSARTGRSSSRPGSRCSPIS
jgi:SAM-dependent methyltransferase